MKTQSIKNEAELLSAVQRGEDSCQQFKRDIRNAESLASDMVAFSNSKGGMLLIGVGDDGSMPGLASSDVHRINQLISNTASQMVKDPINPISNNILLANGNVVIALSIGEGLNKPYFDNNGVIWLKTGSDKRRVNSKEELRRLFQESDFLHADELPTKADIKALDKFLFRDFLKERYDRELPDNETELCRLLENMNLYVDGRLNLAGLLIFGEKPQLIKPALIVKAVAFPGNDIAVEEYKDSEDIEGCLTSQFHGAMGFIMRNLRKVQKDQGVNTSGIPEIPRIVFEELLVNALVHRDYLINAPVRIMIFDNRVEIASPGSLPNHLTVPKIESGNSIIRNPILASYVAKKILPYRGLGSGIPRALKEWPDIRFQDDKDAVIFKADVRRLNADDKSISISGKPMYGRATGEVTGEATGEVTGEAMRLLRVLKGDMKRSALQQAMDLKHEDYFREMFLTPALESGLVEMTIPGKSKSPNQKYRLTSKGLAVLAKK
jgi:ATP-dependent DNA helicase RecG